MDPVTQIAAGAAVAAAFSRPSNLRMAVLVGGLAGGAPDLDVLIRSESDPLLALEYHRHFTHSLFFAPVLGALIGWLLYWILNLVSKVPRNDSIKFGIVGALTHGPIDACTSYGTLLYWPLSDHRESWDVISIIDPLFTPALLCALICAMAFRSVGWARLGVLYCVLYLCFGLLQRERAEGLARSMADSRGHSIEDLSIRPSFANLVVWRLIYFDGEQYHVDAVNLMPFREPILIDGERVGRLDEDHLATLIPRGSVQWADYERFDFFSQGYVYQLPDDPLVIGDLRYAMSPEEVVPLWGIRLNPGEPESHVSFSYFREDPQGALARLWTMIIAPRTF